MLSIHILISSGTHNNPLISAICDSNKIMSTQIVTIVIGSRCKQSRLYSSGRGRDFYTARIHFIFVVIGHLKPNVGMV